MSRAASARCSGGSDGSACNSRCTMRPRASACGIGGCAGRGPAAEWRNRDRARIGRPAHRPQPIRVSAGARARRRSVRAGMPRRPACASASTVPSPSSAGSSTASRLQGILDQLIPAALRHFHRRARPRPRADRPRASSPHRGAGDTRSRRPARRSRAPPRPARRRRPCVPPIRGGRACPAPRCDRHGEEPRLLRALRRRGGVGEDHDRRLQPLRAVHRHHAHLVARDVHVAFDLRVAAARSHATKPCRVGASWRS